MVTHTNAKTGSRGLSSEEAARRLEENGANVLESTKKIRPLAIFLSQFRDVLTLILIIATVLSFVMGDVTEAVAIIAIIIINSTLGFVQEYRTEKTIESLRSMAAPHSKVLRNGNVEEIASRDIVVGDIIIIEAGDRVPADARITEAFDLNVDESLLTGESMAVEKGVRGAVFMGTIVTKGRARAEVTATGMATEMGKIAGMLDTVEESETPLQRKLSQLGKYIAIGCLAICTVVCIAGILRGEDIFDMFMIGISLAVAAVPEGLAAIVTISLALAVSRMVKSKALIRKLHAVETLGCSTIVCSDKTGTLTENKMTVRRICTFDEDADTEKLSAVSNALSLTLTGGCICNNAELLRSGKVSGDPTEAAILLAGTGAGIDHNALAAYKKLDEIPFDSDRKCMSVLAGADNKRIVFTKGAPDVIVQKCSRVLRSGGDVGTMTAAARSKILRKNDEMASDALRVLAVAYDPNPGTDKTKYESGLIFLGLIGMIDPPRKSSYKAVRVCKRAGIKPVMITGDHAVTAKAIALELGIYAPGDMVLTGEQLDAMTERDLIEVVQQTTVFARVSPKNKLQIVRALKSLGHVVAMTGDGVNDAPAIKEADIGVAMGVSGTDVAKEAADVILLDDNFATLVSAVEEGRVIYKNIRKFIRYLLSCNVGEVLTMFFGILLGFPVVLLPIQILWVNLVTDGLPAIALGMDPPDTDVMTEKPRKPTDGVFSGGLGGTIITRGIIIAVSTLCTFMLLYTSADRLATARTGAFMTLVLSQLVHVFECKSETKSIFDISLLNNKWLIGAGCISLIMILAVIYIPVLQGIFRTVPLSLGDAVMTFLISAIGPLINALTFKTRKKGAKKAQENISG